MEVRVAKNMDQALFEMSDVRRRTLKKAVWIPLRAAVRINESGKHDHVGWVNDGQYIPARAFRHYNDEPMGEHLVLSQHFNSVDPNQWHLSQDLVVTLGLKREGDSWVRPDEGYLEVARLARTQSGE